MVMLFQKLNHLRLAQAQESLDTQSYSTLSTVMLALDEACKDYWNNLGCGGRSLRSLIVPS